MQVRFSDLKKKDIALKIKFVRNLLLGIGTYDFIAVLAYFFRKKDEIFHKNSLNGLTTLVSAHFASMAEANFDG